MSRSESKELVETGNGLVSIDEAAKHLADLAREGNADALEEVRLQAMAHREYEKRSGFKERADHFSRLMVMTEAAIGAVDVRNNPWSLSDPLVVGGHIISNGTRSTWRLFAISKERGHFDEALDDLSQDLERGISRNTVERELQRRGAAWVDPGPLRKRFKELQHSEGLTVAELSRRTGQGPKQIAHRLGINEKRDGSIQKRVHFPLARQLAEAIDVDPWSLPVAHLRKRPRERRAKPRKLTGGRLDTTYTLIRKALAELDAAAGESGKWGTKDAYHHLYEAEEIVGKALRRAT